MGLFGKGFWIWKIPSCESGNAASIAAAASAAKLTHVMIKIADGVALSNYDSINKIDYIAPVVSALKAKGIQVWGWHYVYGNDPLREARLAAQRTLQYNMNGYIIDAEVEYKQPGRSTVAKTFMSELRKYLPSQPIALSTFRFPSYHMEFPFNAFLEKCDLTMPQVYWEEAHNADAQLTRCVTEYKTKVISRPLIPTGPSYKVGKWASTTTDITLFMQTALKLNLLAVNFFSWDECKRDLPTIWSTVSSFNYSNQAVLDFPEKFITTLNTRNVDSITSLYADTAVQITPTRTIQGTAAIKSWYTGLFNQVLPNAVFNLVSSSGTGSTRHINWKCTSSSGNVQDGSDTFGIANDMIIYHYSFFKVT